jgi:hypothetical protein
MKARAVVLSQLVLWTALAWPAPSAAAPSTFDHGTLEQTFTATRPSTPSGGSYRARYHGAGGPETTPPYMRKMTFDLPRGMRWDTSGPERCGASDVELAVAGAEACPAGSRLGGGEVQGLFMGSFPSTVAADTFNNEREVVMVLRSPFLATVVRGRMSPDETAIEYRSSTCYPSTPAGCPVDNVLQLGSSITTPPYTRTVNGVVRGYLTTPPKCPKSRRWQGVIRFWWADGSQDTVPTSHPCKRPKPKRRPAG